MFKNLIYSVFYTLIHKVFSIFECLFSVYESVLQKVSNYQYHEFDLTSDFCDKIFQNLSKTPTHLTILLSGESPSYKDLANIIVWCLAARISFISFYDHKGILKKNESKLAYEVSQIKRPQDHVIWHDENLSHKNGYLGRKIHVKVLSEDDGRKSIVNLTKDIATCKTHLEYTIENIDSALHKQFVFPDPDLGLYCGKSLTLYKYPPWQIRVTEFTCITSHHNITFKLFLDQLLRYSKCEQRLGK